MIRNHFSRSLPLLALLLPICGWAAGDGYLAYTKGHVDFGPRIANGQLTGYWKNDGATVNGHVTLSDYPAEGIRALAVFDAQTPPVNRPAASQWNFLGVGPGEPIYILPSSGVPNTVPYLGFATEDPSVAIYDSFRITLTNMTGPSNAVFSLYTSSANVTMNTTNGFPAGTLHIAVGDHLHFNWAFSHIGIYDLMFQFEAMVGATVITTGQDIARFQITAGGGFANYDEWRTAVFRPGEIGDETISGKSITNINGTAHAQRYAFGPDPVVEYVWLEHNGEPVPGMRFYERTSAEDLTIQPERALHLSPSDWGAHAFVLVDSNPVFHDPGLVLRTYRLQTPLPSNSFLRVRANFLELP